MSGAQVTVQSGRLDGSVSSDDRVRRFLGVPYAAPPIGDLRWRPPTAVDPWRGVRSAQRYSPSAPQPAVSPRSLYWGGENEFDEDCLYLNVWTGPEGDAQRPVLVWFHFGGFHFGSAANPLYDGTELARSGVTVVTVNYRLGRLGFLAHPALSAESDEGVSGNYGLLDQVESLRWVRDNIEAFGGDPGRVSVGGVSAGGHSVHNLRACDHARGLFHRAVVHSGPGLAPALDGPGHPANPQTLAAGEDAGTELGRVLGVRTAAQLREIPADVLVDATLPRAMGAWINVLAPGAPTSMHSFDCGYPVVDGHVLRESPLEAYASGRAIDVPMLVGGVGNEGAGLPFLSSVRHYEQYVRSTYGSCAEDMLRLYPADSDAEVPNASRQLEADRVFNWSTWTAARLQSRHGSSPVWHFRFQRELPIPSDSRVLEKEFGGAVHGADLPYLFGSFSSMDFPWTNADRQLGEQLRTAWSAFAANGDPNTAPLLIGVESGWPAFAEDAPNTVEWDSPVPTVSTWVQDDRMRALDAFNRLTDVTSR
ncbi:carboxylesterase family protein [Acrocarpospora macrocephala]|uniref:Carboxylic ester hydrolase n=2 Tax=Acrocarpospora macrocephala TaxID=150177 RepID=A0A5M3WLY8_9ACTN|nr:carboxylic ester hydrolase [Acrocarpospora macrocephala]